MMQMLVGLPLLGLFIFGLSYSQGQNNLGMANNGFAIDLYKKLANENQGRNLFFSPISISTAFGMVNLGTKGDTQTQLKTVLHLKNFNSDADINEAFKQLLAAVKTEDNTGNYTLHVANRLFGSGAFKFQQRFLEESQKYFQTSLEGLDFRGNPEGSRLHINDWVANETNQKIKDLLPTKSIGSDTKLVIVNAIYFQAFWTFPFNKELTTKETFRISKTEVQPIDMMKSTDKKMLYYNSSDLECEVVELPYHGDKASMIIFLPRDVDGLKRVEEELSAEKLSNITKELKAKNINLKFPKFTIDQDLSLKKFLQLLGLLDLFDGSKCDLSGITGDRNLVVGDAVHKAFVKVTEFGTEAAGATAIGIVGSSMTFSIPVTVDRPFLFLILEKNTGSVLFMGRLVRPPAESESIGKFGESAALRTNSSPRLGHGSIIWSTVVILLTSLLF